MSITKLKEEKILAPFLGASLTFVQGLDQLGLLNAGDRTFNLLLPGMTSVTNRIRYFSFYCWFFDFYANEIRLPGRNDQNRFLRRAEYLSALISAHTGQGGVPGNTKAKAVYKNEPETFNLLEGTYEREKSLEGSYWKNRRGIFGQNYTSPMRQMALVYESEHHKGTYIRSDFELGNRISGKQLAEAFERNIGKRNIEIFKNGVLNGIVTIDELSRLSTTFDMKAIPVDSEEHRLLWHLLIGPDHPNDSKPTDFRLNTIRALLQLIGQSSEKVVELSLVFKAYHSKGKIDGQQDDTLTLWYFFQMDQFWHMICAGIMSSLLTSLYQKSNGGWIIENKFINELANEASDSLCKELELSIEDKFKEIPISELDEEDLIEMIRVQSSPIVQIAINIQLLRKLLSSNADQIKFLAGFTSKHGINLPATFISSYDKLTSWTELGVNDFIYKFIKHFVVLRHQWVALKKMNNTQSTEKFIRENGFIRWIDNIGYGYSSPRLGTLMSFLADLGLITPNVVHLTPLGIEYLNTIEK